MKHSTPTRITLAATLGGGLLLGLAPAAVAGGWAPDYCQPAFTGTDGDDRYSGNTGANHMCALGGSDELYGRRGNDWIEGGAGDEWALVGGPGRDELDGGEGSDYLSGGRGGDWLYGDSETDTLVGGGGVDTLYGDAGDDYIYAADGLADDISCGDGYDWVEIDSSDPLPDDCETWTEPPGYRQQHRAARRR